MAATVSNMWRVVRFSRNVASLHANIRRRTISRTSIQSARFISTEERQQESDLVVSYVEAGEDTGEDLGQIIVLAINRPTVRNALGKNIVGLFIDAINSAKFDKRVRTLILRSAVPGIFCAGADLKERVKMAPNEVAPFVAKARGIMSELENLPMPVIAALDGGAYGGGLEMALACDIRIASTTAKMGLTETKLAIIPGAGGTQRLPRIIGKGRAKEMIFTGRVIDGEQAEGIGLVNYAVKQNEEGTAAYKRALEMAKEICSNGPIGVKMTKVAINKGSEVDLQSGLAIEEMCYAQTIPTKDRLIALKAFADKKRPIFIGE
uniref:Methylglutaconyl-CoA hydratase, mitochondrial-like n=1 Tax=Saccoglossus kowalevskii TaxID=10224 RepID=A0ABM0GZ68_SACKO|nr:PREDICTED: methylglutaconyl-CoA hydratase, mitochondrial-like [Saccoglossus kowalevskii]